MISGELAQEAGSLILLRTAGSDFKINRVSESLTATTNHENSPDRFGTRRLIVDSCLHCGPQWHFGRGGKEVARYQGTAGPEDANGGNGQQDVEFSRGNTIPRGESRAEEGEWTMSRLRRPIEFVTLFESLLEDRGRLEPADGVTGGGSVREVIKSSRSFL
jgi:hypothetical protein